MCHVDNDVLGKYGATRVSVIVPSVNHLFLYVFCCVVNVFLCSMYTLGKLSPHFNTHHSEALQEPTSDTRVAPPFPALRGGGGDIVCLYVFSFTFVCVLCVFAHFCAVMYVFARFCVFWRIFECFCALGAILGARGALLGVLETLLGALGALLGALGALLGALGALLGALGPS